MSVVINTNYSATIASNNLAASNSMLQKSLNRLSSGSKIVSPADDAGGLAVSMKMSAAAKRSGAVATNISNSVSLLQTQDGALKVAGKVLDRISELKTLYADPTKNASDLANYDSEFTALKAQLSAISSEKFNGNAMFGTGATFAV
ncbi:MAG TPA: flagellin, partial [Opitutaceae bacterium]|nr:flagellin [Opitutaceae bacterium]